MLGPGDDCAVLRLAPGTDLCVTTDALVEGVHFDPALFSDADIGHKALAVNLSDLAAMGARPRWFVCSIACRPKDTARLPRIAQGMAALANRSGIALIGGNLSRAEALSIHITATGQVRRHSALTRSGARQGDWVYVTGVLGEAALALTLPSTQRGARSVLARQLRPEPRLEAGLIARRFARAAIDISDGLLQDLRHVAEASKVGIRIDAREVPVSDTFRKLAADLELALSGGEDYELALFVPRNKARAFEAACQEAGEEVHLIGEAVRGQGVVVENAPRLRSWGFDHFGKGGR